MPSKTRKTNSKGYVNAEEVLGVLNPVYDEWNIAFETEREFSQAFGYPRVYDRGNRMAEMKNYEATTRRGIEAALARIYRQF